MLWNRTDFARFPGQGVVVPPRVWDSFSKGICILSSNQICRNIFLFLREGCIVGKINHLQRFLMCSFICALVVALWKGGQEFNRSDAIWDLFGSVLVVHFCCSRKDLTCWEQIQVFQKSSISVLQLWWLIGGIGGSLPFLWRVGGLCLWTPALKQERILGS